MGAQRTASLAALVRRYQNPLPDLAANCHRCGAKVECYDEQGVAWCMECAPPRLPSRGSVGG